MIIHQYTSIDSLALILKNKTIRFKRLDKMDDIEEAALSNAGIHLGGFMFVSCWTFNEIESIPLWRMYTPTTKGVRISLDKNMFKKITNYCKESYDELVHKVSWPTRSELSSSAVVVLYASLLIALVVFLMDSAFQFIMEDVIYPH